LKIANIIANTVEKLNAVVVLEKPLKQCPRNMIRGVKGPTLRHRIYQAVFRGIVRAIEEKCLERNSHSQGKSKKSIIHTLILQL